MMTITSFIDHHYRHFNAATVRDAARAWNDLLAGGGKMFVTLAGAMSTAELGLSLAEMIRRDKVHAICCTGANLEEDVFNLVAHDEYERIPNYRDLTPADEVKLLDRGLARVTDTCIPEEAAMDKIREAIYPMMLDYVKAGERRFPHELFFEMLTAGKLKQHYQIDPKDSWLIAAAERKLPMFVPGWEDSTIGNGWAAKRMQHGIDGGDCVKSGIDYMMALTEWYTHVTRETPVGFFQIGGGIAGDFPICVVPMIRYDLEKDAKSWAYFCQISDSTTSYGSYSGAVPNEKITWGKVDPDTPKFVIESDATIVAPLMFAYVLGW